MTFEITPWMYLEFYAGLSGGLYHMSPFVALPSPLWGLFGVPLSTYAAVQAVGNWYRPGEYTPGWANRFFADRAPTVPPQPRGRDDFVADIQKKGYTSAQAAAIYDKLMHGRTDDGKRQFLANLGEVKSDRLHEKDKQVQKEMMARAGAARGLGVGNEEDLKELLKKYEKLNYESFLEAIRREIAAS